MSSTPADPRSLLMSWSDVCLYGPSDTRPILSAVSGYVEAGGMTAILGVSSSGKTVLMSALAGRANGLWKRGTVVLDGVEQPLTSVQGDLVYEADQLIGDLTVREVLTTSFNLRGGQYLSSEDRKAHVESTIAKLGLAGVADNVIGTVLRRGLSGGQKRRTSVAVELVQPPTVLFIDEPTSGLDASAAYTLCEHIRTLARASQGQLGVVLSLQQPNLRLLQLVDQLLLLGQGSMLFFGTLDQSLQYFARLGLVPPDGEAPSDYYLRITDPSAAEAQTINFLQSYQASPECAQVLEQIAQHKAKAAGTHASWKYRASYWQQFVVLLRRNLTVAVRDPTVYLLQMVLHIVYSFLIGALFFDYDTTIGVKVNNIYASITWLTYVNSYINVFKTYFVVTSNARFHHEHANHAYAAVPYWLAEAISTAIASVIFIPGIAICFFMMKLPAHTFGFTLLTLYVVTLCAEASVHFVSHFFLDASYASVFTQVLMVVLSVFATGVLIRPSLVPPGLKWLQSCSYFYWSSLAIADDVLGGVTYTCANNSFALFNATTSTCDVGLYGIDFPCDAGIYDERCHTKGKTVLSLLKGITNEYRWSSFGKLVAVGLGFKCLTLLFYLFPMQTTYAKILTLLTVNKTRLTPLPPTTPATIINVTDEVKPKVTNLPSVSGTNSVSQLIWRDLTLTLPKGNKVLLDHVSGSAKGGRIVSLMGPSGAGKTTLLNALCGRATYARVQGEVLFDNRPMTRHDLDYVPQFDELNEYFTVEELTTYTARLKRRVIDTDQDLADRVEELLHILGLADVRKKRPGRLTGGQRKRVSIGLGLVSKPRILFLDEPTTGLDSSAAYNIVGYMSKAVRATGVVCIMTIHQPSGGVFSQLHDLYLLEHGRLAFAGSLADAEKYFAHLGFVKAPDDNPADFFLDLVAQNPQKTAQEHGSSSGSAVINDTTTWAQLFYGSPFGGKVSATTLALESTVGAPPEKRIGELRRFFILLWKLIKSNTFGPVYLLRVVQLIILGVYVGLLFLQESHSVARLTELSAANFMSIWIALLVTVAAAPAWAIERRQVQVEYVNGQYGLLTYKAAQLVASLPFNFACSVIFQAPLFWMVGFNNWFPAYVYAVASTTVLMVLFEGLVLTVVETVKTAMLATTMSLVQMGMFFLFPGFFLPVSQMPPALQWISWLVATKWALRGSFYNVMNGQTFSLVGGGTISGNDLFAEAFSYPHDVNKWQDWAVVIGWAAFFQFQHLGALWFTNRNFGKPQVTKQSTAGFLPGLLKRFRAPAVPSTKAQPALYDVTDQVVPSTSEGVITTVV